MSNMTEKMLMIGFAPNIVVAIVVPIIIPILVPIVVSIVVPIPVNPATSRWFRRSSHQ